MRLHWCRISPIMSLIACGNNIDSWEFYNDSNSSAVIMLYKLHITKSRIFSTQSPLYKFLCIKNINYLILLNFT